MKPTILFFHPADESSQSGGCDGDCSALIEQGCDGDCSAPRQDCCNGDGACSSSISSFSHTFADRALDGKVLVQNKQEWRYRRIDADHQVILSPQSRVPLLVLNTPAQEILDFFSEPRQPGEWSQGSSISYEDVQLAIAQFYRTGILREANGPAYLETQPLAASALESWIYLTRACNLLCAHCFVSKDVRRMSPETGLLAVDRLFELAIRHGHHRVKIKYAGGEPTMNWELIPAMHRRAKSRSEQTRLGIAEVLVTNATLLNRARLQFIKDEKLRLSISMDGFGEGHDRQRPVLNGNQTFQRVLGAVHLALETGLSPFLIITITRLNLEEVPELVAFALRHRLLLNLSFYRPHTANDPLVPENAELTRALQNALQVIESNLPDYNFLEGLIDRSNFGVAHQHVCGAGRNYLSIDTDGSVLPCHMLTGYNLPGIPLQTLESPRFDDFANPSIEQRNGCNTCDWRHWCAGGCPILAKNIMGTSNISSPYCSVYKAIYPELIRLRALQLVAGDRRNV